VPDAVAACITKAFAHKADDRHADMHAIVLLLEPFVATKEQPTVTQEAPPVAARPKTTKSPPQKPKKDPRTIVFAIALAVTCVIGVVVAAVAYTRGTQKPSEETARSPESPIASTPSASGTAIELSPPASDAPPALSARPPSHAALHGDASSTADAGSPYKAPQRAGQVSLQLNSAYLACEKNSAGVAGDTGRLAGIVETRKQAVTACFSRRFDQPIKASYLNSTLLSFSLLLDRAGVVSEVRTSDPSDLSSCASELKGLKLEPLTGCETTTLLHVTFTHNCKCDYTGLALDGARKLIASACTRVVCKP